MTEDKKICPYKAKEVSMWPYNTCVPKGSYCNWPCEYESCDTYKSHTKVVNMLAGLKGSSDE